MGNEMDQVKKVTNIIGKPQLRRRSRTEINKIDENSISKKNIENYDNFIKNWDILNSYGRIKTSDSIYFDSDLLVSENKGNLLAKYEIIRPLGQGSFGLVFLVRHKISGQVRAMKILRRITEKGEETDKQLINEINILKKIDHPSIIKIFSFYIGKTDFILITEYCSGGELYDKMGKDHSFSEIQIAFIMYQILSAVNYCHKLNIVHRDLKPENILIKKIEDNIFYRVSIIDFGTSQILSKIPQNDGYVYGTPYYMAPEVLQKKNNIKCDIWSCGVILYLFLANKYPFMGKDIGEMAYNVINHPHDTSLLKGFSPSCLDLLSKMLEKDPEKRISAEEAINHPFFQETKAKEILNNFSDNKVFEYCFNNMKNYNCRSILQETALAYLVHNYIDLEGAVEAGKLFSKIDTDGNGVISSEEFFMFMTEKGVNEDLIAELFEKIDTDHDMNINYEDFIRASIDKSIFLNENALRFAFDYFDIDGSGEITLDEIAQIFKNHIKSGDITKGLKKIISEVDINKDGKVQFSEFKQIMKRLTK